MYIHLYIENLIFHGEVHIKEIGLVEIKSKYVGGQEKFNIMVIRAVQ